MPELMACACCWAERSAAGSFAPKYCSKPTNPDPPVPRGAEAGAGAAAGAANLCGPDGILGPCAKAPETAEGSYLRRGSGIAARLEIVAACGLGRARGSCGVKATGLLLLPRENAVVDAVADRLVSGATVGCTFDPLSDSDGALMPEKPGALGMLSAMRG